MNVPAEKCPENRMIELLQAMERDDGESLKAVERVQSAFPNDESLHFLRGSLLAADGAYDAAQRAMARAIEIEPGYLIARFQLGLLQLSSGDASAARGTWGPLASLEPSHPLRLFSEGLQRMADDQFREAIELITQGLANNTENAALNRDMRMMLDQIQALLENAKGEQDPTSSTHFLIQQSESKRTMH